MQKELRKVIISGVIGVSLLGGAVLGITGLSKIPAGMVGIVYKADGGVSKELLGQGWRWKMPILNKVSIYSTSMEQSYMCAGDKGDSEGNESFPLMTSDGKEVTVDLEYSYKFDRSRLPETFSYFKGADGETIRETFIKPKMTTVSNNVSTQFDVFSIYGKGRPDLNAKITKEAKEYFDKYGILIDSVSVTKVTPDNDTKKAIQAKVDKLQDLEIAKTNKQIAKEEADKAEIVATGKAKSKIITAEAEKKANELMEKSLTPGILKQQELKKWNGTVPQVVGGNTITNIPGLSK